MKWILLLALSLVGCATPVTVAYKATIMAMQIDELDKTPEEQLADIDWWIKANRKWCQKGKEQSACREVVRLLAARENLVYRMTVQNPSARQKEIWGIEK